MSAAQKKVIDDHCNSQWAVRAASPWADFEHAGIAKLKADPAHEVYTISAAQLAEWKKAAAPVVKVWADSVKKAGNDRRCGPEGPPDDARQAQLGLLSAGPSTKV